MEIYRQAQNRVYFEAPDTTAVVAATIALNGGTPVVIPTVNGNGTASTLRSIDIPYINSEGTLVVEWSWGGIEMTTTGMVTNNNIVQKDTYDVVTPVLGRAEIVEIHPNATPAEVVSIEKATRHIINAHTGQKFGLFDGIHKVPGNGGTTMLLPQRLLKFKGVNGSTDTVGWSVESDGWVLRHYPWGVPPVKADAWGYHMHVGGVIHNPFNVKLGVFEKREYSISGEWGWSEVPEPVREAAKLLINDYACADTSYRDRYLQSMTAADWRIQFNQGAFNKTGNVRADQLLNDFVLKRGWAVI